MGKQSPRFLSKSCLLTLEVLEEIYYGNQRRGGLRLLNDLFTGKSNQIIGQEK